MLSSSVEVMLVKDWSVKNISIDELKCRIGAGACYADDCLFVSESLQYLCCTDSVRLDFSLMVFCTSGCIRWGQNGNMYSLYEHDFGIILSGNPVTKMSVSNDCKMKVVGLSDRFLQRLFRNGTDVWHLVRFVKSHPVKHLEWKNFELLLRYVDLIATELAIGDIIRREEIMQHLLAALVLGMMSDIDRSMALSSPKGSEKVSPSAYTFRRFVEELYADSGHHRSVTYYANKLCCSPTYLSRLVKRMSGKKALSLINEHAIDRIAFELKYTDKTIKEIAVEFDFPNVSFFAKYVRRHLKFSPSMFRSKTR